MTWMTGHITATKYYSPITQSAEFGGQMTKLRNLTNTRGFITEPLQALGRASLRWL